jgi:NTP pyrophosphatase (non-canonical NTP hydrolase)
MGICDEMDEEIRYFEAMKYIKELSSEIKEIAETALENRFVDLSVLDEIAEMAGSIIIIAKQAREDAAVLVEKSWKEVFNKILGKERDKRK